MSWIKVENATPNKPEVLRLARLLGVSRDDAFGKAMRFWIWLDGVTVDGVVDGVTSHDVDAVVGCDGLASALCQAGWLTVSEDGQSIVVPNFERHNGESAKARGLKTKRQAKWRAGAVDGDASTEASTVAPPEKIRVEETKNTTPDCHGTNGKPNGVSVSSQFVFLSLAESGKVPEVLKSERFAKSWDSWVKHRSEIKKPLHETMVVAQLKMLASKGLAAAVQMIDHTVAMGWQGLREPESSHAKPTVNGRTQPAESDNMPPKFSDFAKAYGNRPDEH